MEIEFEVLKKYLSKKKISGEKKMVLPKLDYSCFEWKNSNKIIQRVYKGDILIENGKLLAFQEESYKERINDYDYNLVIIKEDKEIFRWKLVQLDRDENRFENLYLGKYKDNIIHIHKHELYITILSLNGEILKRFNYWGELINKKENIISFKRISPKDKNNPVELIEIPELNKLKSISYEEAEIQNLKPHGNFAKDFLRNK